jgi:signal transduction histidine kinase
VGVNWHYKIAGYVGWLAIALPSLVDIGAGRLSGVRAMVWGSSFVVFGAVYALYLRPDPPAYHRSAALRALAVLAASGLTMVLASVGLMKYLASITLTIVAGELPYVLSPRMVWAWVVVQSAVLCVVFWLSFDWVSGVAGGSAYAGFQVFALGRAWLEQRERTSREALTRTNAELRATQALLAENSRVAERLRISRDLHDALGHHLTALSLQLDVAARKSDGAAADHVQEAHAITRLLLSDVRSVVGQLRDRAEIELADALKSLASEDTVPKVHVEIGERLSVETPAQANVLLRAAQEIVTNAVKHARARNVWIRVVSVDNGIEMHARDDGQGVTALVAGHGLSGMRERFTEHGGTIEFTSAPGRGFSVDAFMPRMESPA